MRSYATTGENLLVERDLTTRLCIKSVPLFSWRARHNCWVTRERWEVVWSWRTCNWTGASTDAGEKKEWQRLNNAFSVCFSESMVTSYSSFREDRSFPYHYVFSDKKFIPCDFLFQKKSFFCLYSIAQ